MITVYNDINYNRTRQSLLGGTVTGLWNKNSFFLGCNSHPVPQYFYMTSNYTDFSKVIEGAPRNVNYHLSGYGTTYNESLVSFLGESAERFSFATMYAAYKDRIVNASFVELTKAYPTALICDLDLINVYFTREDVAHFISDEDVLQWVPMISLFDPKTTVFIPLQMVVMYEKTLFENEKRVNNSAVSTGTACHESFPQALENSISELLQIDSLNLWWYGGHTAPKVEVNIEDILTKYFSSQQKAVKMFLSHFDVRFLDISYDKPLHIVVCEITTKNPASPLPKYVVGSQASSSMETAVYRSFFECMTVVEYALNVSWMDTDKFKKMTGSPDKQDIDNLDDNVIYYAKYGRPVLKHQPVSQFSHQNKASDLSDLIRQTQSLSKFACYLPISSSEFQHLNLDVVKVITPELLPISLPSYPPFHHPRFKQTGGIHNRIPHPLA